MNLSWLRLILASQPELVTPLEVSDAAITNAKLADLARGSIKVGGADNAVTDLDAKTSGRVLVGDGTDLKSVAVSGDATLSSAGALTIGTGAITATKIGTGAVTETKIGTGAVTDAKVAEGANIAASKISLASGQVAIGNSSNVAEGQTISGDITISNAGVAAIGSGVIVNADINTAAAIAFSKLATLTSTNILVGNGSNVAAAVAVSGDATLANTGELTIGSSKITIAKCANELQDLIATASVAGVDNTNGTGTFTVQVKDAAGNNLTQYSLLRVWRSAAAYGAAASATGFVSASGTTLRTVAANADLEVITTDQGAATFNVTDNGAHHVNVEVNGRIYTGTVTVTTA